MDDSRAAVDRFRTRSLATLAALAVLGLGISGAVSSRAAEVAGAAAEDEEVLGDVTTAIAAGLERGMRGVATIAVKVPLLGPGAASSPSALASVPGASELGFVPIAEPSPSEAAPPVLSIERRRDPAVAALLDRARDSGEPQMGAALDLGQGPRTLVVAAVYDVGSPQTTADRRVSLAGWVVAPVDLASLAVLPEGSVAWVEDGAVTFGTSVGGDLRARTLVIEGRSFRVHAGSVAGASLTARTVGLTVAAAALAVLAGLLVLAVSAWLSSQRALVEQQTARVRLISEVAPLVQRSLELGEVLPAVAVQLSDQFGLAGVSVSVGSSRAGQSEVFGSGVTPDQAVAPVLRAPEVVEAGETVALALQRGGRSVAVLRVVAGRTLVRNDLESLHALTELVTAAIVNASLFASQQEALIRLRELDDLKMVFLSTASHELRTPVTAIGGFAGLLEKDWDRFTDEERRDFTGRIAANARSLSAVVQDLLDFALLDRAGTTISVVPVDLGEIVESVVDRLRLAFTEHEIACNMEIAPRVAGHQNGLERIVTNLLTNAVKFSPAGSTITISVRPEGEGAALVVSDQGTGVPIEEREHIFTRFYRGAAESVVQTRGVGIGLAVVAEFTSRMSGQVSIDDAPGGGARFTVWLPAAPQPNVQETDDAPEA